VTAFSTSSSTIKNEREVKADLNLQSNNEEAKAMF
jgi:hypothetical protein